MALDIADVGPATHRHHIDDRSIVEAFPTTFMGVMFAESEIPATRRANRSDVFYMALAENGSLERLLTYLLPGRVLVGEMSALRNHDERAALICAVTALCVAKDAYCAVGDDRNGWIILPPCQFVKAWAQDLLIENGREDTSYVCSCSVTPPFRSATS